MGDAVPSVVQEVRGGAQQEPNKQEVAAVVATTATPGTKTGASARKPEE